MKIAITVCLQLLIFSSVHANDELDQMVLVEENESVFLFDAQTNIFKKAMSPVKSSKASITGVRSRIMSSNVRAYDPINRKNYSNVLLGQVFTSSNPFNGYSHWRYITVFNKRRAKERIAYLPSHEEACYDDSFFFAEWSKSRTVIVGIEAKGGVEAMGLSSSVAVSVSEGTTFSTNRRLKATLGVRAIHTPYKVSTTYSGVTYIMTYDSATKKHNYLMSQGFSNYPYKFSLDNQDLGFQAERKVLETCEVDESTASSGMSQWIPR